MTKWPTEKLISKLLFQLNAIWKKDKVITTLTDCQFLKIKLTVSLVDLMSQQLMHLATYKLPSWLHDRLIICKTDQLTH